MRQRHEARRVLNALVGRELRTLTGRPNTILAIEGDSVRVATTRSPAGQRVPIKWIQDALDCLASDGEVEISVESVGYRSAFIGAGPEHPRLRRGVTQHDARGVRRPLTSCGTVAQTSGPKNRS